MKLSISNFKAALPRWCSLLLQGNYAQEAVNCRLSSGELKALRAPKLVETLTLTGGSIEGIYLWRVGSGDVSYWLRFDNPVDVIKSPIADDAYSRLYWSGDGRHEGAVLYSYTPAVYTGGTEYPANFYRLGIPAPTIAPIMGAVTQSGENLSDEARFYVYTYVGKLGEESPPSPPSGRLIISHDGASVTVTGLSLDQAATTGREIERIRLYRTLSGSVGTVFLFLDDIPATQTSYTDTKSGDQLAEALPSASWDPPRLGMKGLGLTPHGIAYGFLGKILCLSDLYKPYAWPRDYELTTMDDIVAVGHYDTHLIVGTTGRPVMVTGADPSGCFQQELPIIEACVAKRSMVSMGFCAIYASPNGLIMATASGAQLVTASLMTKDEWSAFNPASIHAYEHEGLYIGFWRVDDTHKGGFIFDPRHADDGLRLLDSWYVAGARDIATDTLHLVDDQGRVWAWDKGVVPLHYRWRSKRFLLDKPAVLTACRVAASAYSDLTVRIYADGQLRHTGPVPGPYPFRLPRGQMARQWEVELVGSEVVQQIELATSVKELQA